MILWKWLEEGNQPDLFIGIKDKNNREIYEGDIVRYDDKYTAVVEWKDRCIHFKFIDGMRHVSSKTYPVIEVVGNIYENPELILDIYDET